MFTIQHVNMNKQLFMLTYIESFKSINTCTSGSESNLIFKLKHNLLKISESI